MAAIWVVFGHSVVISKNEKWSTYNGFEPGILDSHTRALDHCTTDNIKQIKDLSVIINYSLKVSNQCIAASKNKQR